MRSPIREYLLTKSVVSPTGRKARIGEEVVFDIVIDNIGDVELTTVPLTDEWDAAYLQLPERQRRPRQRRRRRPADLERPRHPAPSTESPTPSV